MRILLTGSRGFIGRNVGEYLGQEHEVLMPTHADLDLTDDQAVDAWFRTNRVDAVIHGAVRPGHRAAADGSGQLWANLRMFFNITRNAGRFGRLVFISSGAVYDTRVPLVRVSENRLGRSIPEDEHGLSKYVIARYIDALGTSPNTPFIELRLFGVFGPHEDYRIRFISNAICRTLFDMPIVLRQDRRFSYLAIEDLMPVIDWALTGAHRHAAYNVVPPWTDSLVDLAEVVRRRGGQSTPVRVAAAGLGREYSADNTRLTEELPRLAFTPTEIAIEQLFHWYAERRTQIDPDSLRVDE